GPGEAEAGAGGVHRRLTRGPGPLEAPSPPLVDLAPRVEQRDAGRPEVGGLRRHARVEQVHLVELSRRGSYGAPPSSSSAVAYAASNRSSSSGHSPRHSKTICRAPMT